MSKSKKIIIIFMSVLVLLLVGVSVILLNKGSVKSRTVMIYMAGSDLESRSGIATSDISSIIGKNINLKNNNILIYSGGTKRWFNFMNPNENAIYKLTENGFERVKSYDKSSLGDSSNFSKFLTYSFNNYKTEAYDLIFWNHGLGVMGSIMDENSKDYLDLVEINEGLNKSPFNKNNKLETIVFRTCLNGTIEMASNISDYANYMVASEEITLGSNETSVLDFLNNIDKVKNGYDFGVNFINSYKKQIDELDYFGEPSSTYSIIDLSKIDSLINKLDNFFKNIDVSKNYGDIVRLRSNLDQYAVDTYGIEDYDTVDLYELISNISKEFNLDSKDLLKYLSKDVIKYNWTTNDYSNGLSIYFPYKAKDSVKEMGLALYNNINMSNEYKKFIKSFSNEGTKEIYSFSYELSDNETVVDDTSNEFKVKLTEDEIKNYASSSYMIFKELEDGYYMPVYAFDDSKIVDGYLVSNINKGLIKIVDENEESESFFNLYGVKTTDNYKEYKAVVTVWKQLEGDHFLTNFNGVLHLRVDNNNKIYADEVLVDSDIGNEFAFASGVTYKLSDFDRVDVYEFSYDVTDEDGNYTTDWGYNDVKRLFRVDKGKYSFKLSNVKDEEGNFYCRFKIVDLQGKSHYSKFVQIN